MAQETDNGLAGSLDSVLASKDIVHGSNRGYQLPDLRTLTVEDLQLLEAYSSLERSQELVAEQLATVVPTRREARRIEHLQNKIDALLPMFGRAEGTRYVQREGIWVRD